MATLTSIVSNRTGVLFVTVPAAAAGDQFLNTGKEIVYLWNEGGPAQTVTITPNGKVGGLSYAPYTVLLGNAEEKMVGPFDPTRFNNGAGMVTMTYSTEQFLSVAVIKFP